MKFIIEHSAENTQQYDCLITGVFEDDKLPENTQKIDHNSMGFIKQLLQQGDFEAKIGQTLMLYSIPHIKDKRILLVGCGKSKPLSELDFRKIITSAIKALSTSQIKSALSFLTTLAVLERDTAWKIKQTVLMTEESLYAFNQFKTGSSEKSRLREISLYLSPATKKDSSSHQTALKQGLAIAESVTLTKNLANLPSNICTPSYLEKAAKQLSKEYKTLTINVLEEKDMVKLGMGAFLAVTKGSKEKPKLICLEYKGSTKAPIAFVGKGITFDTGGLSLKPADSMVGMKYDMCGAATVLGTLKAAAALKLPLHLIGLLACAENMPSGNATKPEDIVTSLSGQTIEIMNTDAEGRLVLCDALTYCEQYQPETVIDIATLTGAVVIALGNHATGLLSNDESLTKDLLRAGNESFDRAWALPLWEEYQEQLKSPFADMSNVGGKSAGTITAACFLSRFAKKFHWAHLDVAGTAAMMGGTDRYATGRPVPMLVQYLINRC